jgi:protein CWC15
MTTAHRPTWNPTRGGDLQGGNKLYFPSKTYSSKDLPSNLNVKIRQTGQGTRKELNKRNFKNELLERERRNQETVRGNGLVSSQYSEIEEDKEIPSQVDITDDLLNYSMTRKKQRTESISDFSESANTNQLSSRILASNKISNEENIFPQDKDLEFSEEESQDLNKEDNQESELDQSDDEEELLLRELEKIKKEREEENKKKEEEKNRLLKIQTQEQILKGNPLLNTGDYSLKKKWYEDTVFKNQARNEPKVKKRFINDSVRSDFHRKFLSKTIQ